VPAAGQPVPVPENVMEMSKMLAVPSCVTVPDAVQFGERSVLLVNVMLFPLPGVKVSGRRVGDAPSIAPPRSPAREVGEPVKGENELRVKLPEEFELETVPLIEVAEFTLPWTVAEALPSPKDP
jgi:hypothetical protein